MSSRIGSKVKLKGKVSIITGAAQGIGYAICSRFAKEGSRVVIADSNADKARKACELVKKDGGDAVVIKADVTKSNEVKNMIQQTIQKFGKLNILVNNVGTRLVTPFTEITDEEWDYIIRVNLTSVFLCSREAVPHLEKERGKIINIASLAGITCVPNRAPYCAAKGGVIVLTRAMAVELASKRITVNCIAPGATLTNLTAQYMTKEDADSIAMKRRWESAIPLGRPANPEDHAAAAVFLASDDADYITGITIPVDGGWVVSR